MQSMSESPSPAAKPLTAPQKALRKLGLVRDIDLALHLPLRYEDETRIVKLADAREGDTVQIEATVTACEITMRPRRQLLVTVEEGSIGGFASHVLCFAAREGLLGTGSAKIIPLYLPDTFIAQNTPKVMYDEAGLNAEQLVQAVLGAGLRNQSPSVRKASRTRGMVIARPRVRER